MIELLALAKPGLDVRPDMPWVVLGVFVLGMGLIAEAYFRSRPPIALRVRILLASLRAAALIALLLIILDPTLSLTSHVADEPRVAVLVDTSGLDHVGGDAVWCNYRPGDALLIR